MKRDSRRAPSAAQGPGVRGLRKILRRKGGELLARLLKENWEYLGTAKIITGLFGVAPSNLRRRRDQGAVIAYRPPKTAEFLYPFEQFTAGGILRDWPAALVSAVGNGAPALHFLYTRRTSLARESFAEVLRALDSDEITGAPLAAIDYLEADSP